MGRQGNDASAAAPGMRIQCSQSKMSLSASFEALAVYFPCMNSFDEDDGGKTTSGEMSRAFSFCWLWGLVALSDQPGKMHRFFLIFLLRLGITAG